MSEVIRAAVVGVHGTGKSTLTHWMAEEFGLQHLPESARTLLTKDFEWDKVGSDLSEFKRFQTAVLAHQADILETAFKTNTSFIMDRSPLDSWVYVKERMSCDRDDDIPYYHNYAQEAIRLIERYPYTHIFYSPFRKEDVAVYLKSDHSLRTMNPIYMEVLDDLMRQEYEDKVKDVYFLPRFGSVEARKDYIRDVLI